MTNIYNSVECDAWSRDFNYEEYKVLCDKMEVVHVPDESYKLMCSVFDKAMIHDMCKTINDKFED